MCSLPNNRYFSNYKTHKQQLLSYTELQIKKKIINNILLSTSTNYHPKNSPKTCTKIKLNQTKSTVTLHQAWPASMPLLILCQSWKKFYLLKKQIYLCDFIYISMLQNTWSLGENILASYLSSRNFNLNNITLLYCSL